MGMLRNDVIEIDNFSLASVCYVDLVIGFEVDSLNIQFYTNFFFATILHLGYNSFCFFQGV